MENKEEGWSLDITSSNHTHYYINGLSLCKRKRLKPFMKVFDKDKNYSQVLGFVCSICEKKIKTQK
jgi:hypothetical protein